MTDHIRRQSLKAIALAAVSALAIGAAPLQAQDREAIKIGYAVSLTGINAGGAGITTVRNYELWQKAVEAAGGLELPDGTRLPVEFIVYDDRSSAEEVVRAVERLATQDEVDFILPPWGTGFNLAAAPLFARFGYPQLAVTAVTDRADEFVARWDNSFWLLGGATDYSLALVDLLSRELEAGQINKQVAMISVADGFGIELATAARPAFEEAGFELVYDVTYPPPTSDFSPMLNEASASEADTFVAFSYPPHTFALMQQMQVADYSPAVLYLGVGSAFPNFQGANGANSEGVTGLGGVDMANEKIVAYRELYTEAFDTPPDYWAGIVTYASLQMLAEAIRRVGLDREAVTEELSTGTFDTAMGEIKLENNQLTDIFFVGQWQNGHFVGVAPTDREGAVRVKLPRGDWQ